MPLSPYFKAVLFNIAVLSYVGLSHAEEVDPNFALVSAAVKDICQKVAAIPTPSGDQPSKALAKTLENCDASDFYYGFHQAANFVMARQCAYAINDFETLTMIYANGQEVSRNWDLAIHFACKAGFSPAEIEGRVMHLVHLRDQHWQGKNFDICDDITSGYMMGVCASYQEQLTQSQRQQRVTALVAAWDNADKTAWLQLQSAANKFFAARSANEIDLSGTGRAAFEIEEQASLQDDLISSLENLANGHFPTYTSEQAAKIDQQLNAVYQKIQKNTEFSVGTIDRQGVKKTQLLWLKYRDAWVEFGKVKYPQVDAQSWKAWVTAKRVKMLQDLAEST